MTLSGIENTRREEVQDDRSNPDDWSEWSTQRLDSCISEGYSRYENSIHDAADDGTFSKDSLLAAQEQLMGYLTTIIRKKEEYYGNMYEDELERARSEYRELEEKLRDESLEAVEKTRAEDKKREVGLKIQTINHWLHVNIDRYNIILEKLKYHRRLLQDRIERAGLIMVRRAVIFSIDSSRRRLATLPVQNCTVSSLPTMEALEAPRGSAVPMAAAAAIGTLTLGFIGYTAWRFWQSLKGDHESEASDRICEDA